MRVARSHRGPFWRCPRLACGTTRVDGFSSDSTDQLARTEAAKSIDDKVRDLKALGMGKRNASKATRALIQRKLQLPPNWRLSRLSAVPCVRIVNLLKRTSAETVERSTLDESTTR